MRRDPPKNSEVHNVDERTPHDPSRLPHLHLPEDIVQLFPAAEVDPPRRGEDDRRPDEELADPVPGIEARRERARLAVAHDDDDRQQQRQRQLPTLRRKVRVANNPGDIVEAHVIECELHAGPLDRRLAAEKRLMDWSPHGAVVAKPCAERSLQARCTPPERVSPTQVIGGRGVTVWCAESAFSPVRRRSAAEVTQSAVGRPRAGMLARDASDVAPNASALAVRAVAENASRIRDGGMRPLQHTAAADNSISVVPLHSVAVIDKSMSVVVTTAGAGAHASAMKKKRRSRSASGEPRSAGRRLRTCAGLAGTRPGGVFVCPLLSRLQVIPKFCKTVITS